MRKTAVFCIVLVLCVLFSANNVFSSETSLNMYAQSGIKQGKAFNIYIRITGECEFADIHLSVSYDSEKLDFKSIDIDGKSEEDKLLYQENESDIDIIYINTRSGINGRDIVLRFQPESAEYRNFAFDADIYELCGCELEYVRYEQECRLDVSLETDDNTVQTHTVSEDKTVSETSRIKSSSVSKSEKSTSNKTSASEKKNESLSESSETENETYDDEETQDSKEDIYRIILEDDVSDRGVESWILYIIIAVLIAVIFFLWFKRSG